MDIDTQQIVLSVITFITGGGLVAIINAVVQNKKVKAEAETLGAKTPVEVQQMTMGSALEMFENLREDNRTLREERDGYKAQLVDMQARLDRMTIEMDRMRQQIAEMLEDPPHKYLPDVSSP